MRHAQMRGDVQQAPHSALLLSTVGSWADVLKPSHVYERVIAEASWPVTLSTVQQVSGVRVG